MKRSTRIALAAGGAVALAAGVLWAATREEDTMPENALPGPGLAPPGAAGVRVALLELTHAAFPENRPPHAAVLIPEALGPTDPLRVWVYVHGHTNCVENVVRDTNGRCVGGRVTATRNSSHLASQLARSGSKAVVVVPAIKIAEPTGAPGLLARPGRLAALVTEALGKVGLGGRPITRTDLMGHSGGYYAMGRTIANGNDALNIRGAVLLDALYGETATFTRWLNAHARDVGMGPEGYRLASITTGGDTATQTAALVAATRANLAGKLTDQLDLRFPVIAARTRLSHTDCSRVLPEQFWRSW